MCGEYGIMKKKRFMDLSLFICPECSKSFPIMRNRGESRKRGHIKDIWCPYCKANRKFKEIRHTDYANINGNIIYM